MDQEIINKSITINYKNYGNHKRLKIKTKNY